jgi:P pilus assembly chaperone PapD
MSGVSVLVASLLASTLSGSAFAEEAKPKIDTQTQSFAVKLNATRVIYDPASNGSTITISNPQDYPILVQSKVVAEDKSKPAPFVVTPPLFRLDAQQQSRLRIVRTGGEVIQDRETLQWLCVSGIPPKNDDAWAKDKDGKSQAPATTTTLNVQVSVSNCIKLFMRPSSIKGQSSDVASSLVWASKAGQLNVNNPTPFYMNLNMVSVGDVKLTKVEYVPPFSSINLPLPKGASGEVQWKVVNDYGGESSLYKASLK